MNVLRLGLLALVSGMLPAAVRAQVVTDGTLGPAVELAGPDYVIHAALGTQRGGNLFHSFDRFGLGATESATFTPEGALAPIDSVLARVTGGQSSHIDGLLRSTIPAADLYLMNPSGVIFGRNAELDVPGSFHATTAGYLALGAADAARFHASPGASSVLSVAAPEAFGFLEGSGAGPDIEPSLEVVGSTLEVVRGETLALVGRDGVSLLNAELSAAGGRIDLAALAAPGELRVEAPDAEEPLDASAFEALGSVELSNSTVTTSGDPPGAVFIRGGPIEIDGSLVLAKHLGADPNAGRVSLKSDGSIALTNGAHLEAGTEASGPGGEIEVTAPVLILDAGGIASTSFAAAGGDAGTIHVTAETLALREGGVISAASEGAGGDAGAIHVTAGSLLVESPLERRPGGISVATSGTGNAGSLRVVARDVSLLDGGFLSASTSEGASGAGGAVEVEAESLRVRGLESVESGIFTGVSGSGDAGTIDLRVQSLEVGERGSIWAGSIPGGGDAGAIRVTAGSVAIREGGSMTAEAHGAGGDAGTIHVTAGSLLVESPVESRPGGISVATGGTGAAGSLRVVARDVSLLDGAFLSAMGLQGASGDGGAIEVEAQSLRVRDAPSGIFVGALGSGSSGTIDVTAQSLEMSVGALIWAGSAGASGDAGTIQVAAESAVLEGGEISAASDGAAGEAGTIHVTAGSLRVESFGGISVATSGAVNAGDIRVVAREMRLLDGAFLAANALEGASGDGGAVEVEAESLRILGLGSGIFTGVQPGTAGTVDVTAESLEISEGGGISAVTRGAGNGGSLRIVARDVSLLDGGFLAAHALQGSSGSGGSVEVEAESLRVLGPGSGILAGALGSGDAGTIDVTAGSLEISERGSITVGSGGGDSGTIDIDARAVRITDQGSVDASVLASSPGAGHAGTIHIVATDSVVLDGREGERFSLLPVVLGLPLDSLTGIFSATRLGGPGGLVSIDAPEITVTDGAIVATSTVGGEDAGSILLTGERIRVSNGAFVDSTSLPVVAQLTTVEAGDAGAVTLEATESIEVAGRGELDPARVTSTTLGAGAAGDVTLSAPRIVIDGGAVAATTLRGVLGATSGSGPGGQIVVEAGELLVQGGGQVNSTSLGQTDASLAGDIRITASAGISIRGEDSAVASRAGGAGEGGNVSLQAPRIEIADGGRVTAESTPGLGSVGEIYKGFVDEGLINEGLIDAQEATADAGRVTLEAGSLVLRNGTIATNAALADGGDVTIEARELVHLDQSAITASVAGGEGGSISIDPILVLLEGGRIEANAQLEGGRGGRVKIRADLFLARGESRVDASAPGGPEFSGTVVINAPDVDLAGSITRLPESFLDASALLRPRCAARIQAAPEGFVVVGSGIPATPDGFLPAPTRGKPHPTALGAEADRGAPPGESP